jgi:dTDP-4-dehydrorhamnose reductase
MSLGPILITGGSGQVGAAVAQLLAGSGRPILVPNRAELDLGSPDSIRAYVRKAAPQWIVSAAAYTAVDAAETDRDAAFAANATAPGILAEEAHALGAGILHFSTDYVFNGAGTRPWEETDATAPLNVYGASKLAGEQAIAATGAAHLILRTSWVYSGGGKNFVRTMLRLLSTKTGPLRIVADQHGAPTAAADLATAIAALIAWSASRSKSPSAALADLSGVYHCAAGGETTWAGLAGAVRQFLQDKHGMHPPEIIPVPTEIYPTPATRPLNSRLNCTKLSETFGVYMPRWDSSVAVACKALAATDLPQS